MISHIDYNDQKMISPREMGILMTVKKHTVFGFVVLACLLLTGVGDSHARVEWKQEFIYILGTTYDREHEPVGIVADVFLTFGKRDDQRGLDVHFDDRPGRFSPAAKSAVVKAIARTAQLADLDTSSWTINLAVPYQGVTVYGESLSAMVGLSVVALAKGDAIPRDRSITGTVTEDGHIGEVTGVPLKVKAAYRQHLRRILVPDAYSIVDGDWETPFLMQVSPVGSVSQAYEALTGESLRP